MESFNINDLLGLESLYSYKDNLIRDPIAGLTPTFDPLSILLPNPLHTEITTPSPSSESTDTVSPVLTEEDEAHIDNLVYFGVDSPVLPPDLLTPPVAAAETPPALAPVVPQLPSTQQTASSLSPLPASSALFSPTTAYAEPSVSPPALKRRFSLITVDEPNEHQEPTPGPSDSEPSKRPRVEPLEPTKSAGQPIGKPPRAARTDYSACRCPDGLTSKPARHWRVCPYNPNAGEESFTCELCAKQFTREDNKFRHVKEYH